MAEPALAPASTCPAWCDRNEPHGPEDYHRARIGSESDVYVHLLAYSAAMEDTAPKVHVFALSPSNIGVLLEQEDAVNLALILEALGRKKVASIIRKAAGIVRGES